MSSIWQWEFPESKPVIQRAEQFGIDSIKGLEQFLKIDPSYKMAAKYEQENWAYKYTDYVFGPPTIARTTMKYIRRMIRNQCIYIYWYDKTEYHFKCEHGRDP